MHRLTHTHTVQKTAAVYYNIEVYGTAHYI